MFVRKISSESSSKIYTFFHLGLGAACTLSSLPIIALFYFALITSLPNLFTGSRQRRLINILMIMAYLCSAELLGRMVSAAPLIPHELSKYLFSFLTLLGILLGGNKGIIGFALLLFLLPSVFIDQSGKAGDLSAFVFNALGPVSLSLMIIFAWQLKSTKEDLQNILRLSLYFPLAVLSYCYIKTPDYDDMNFYLGANFDASGGFGSNQVSTVLGLGMFLVFIFWLNRWRLTGYRWLDAILFFGFAFQGLLTFSRGGMLAGALAIVVVLLIINISKARSPSASKGIRAIRRYAIPGILIAVGAFIVADSITGGRLSLRYRGQTEGTLVSGEEITIGKFTTGRYDIFIGDIALWEAHPIFGVGVGASRYLRETLNGVVAHVELSRLLAEHGTMGLLFFVILLLLPLSVWRKQQDPVIRAIMVSLFTLAIFTTFHAAMRTYVTPLFTGICLLSIVDFTQSSKRKHDTI